MTHPPHDYDNPESELRYVETMSIAAEPLCIHCTPSAVVTPGWGVHWVLDVEHERDCPIARATDW